MSGLFALPMSAREHLSFDKGWLFTLADSAGMWKADYADAHWRSLNLPHDWAIEGDFSPGNPSGASGGALPGGIGWYRKHFSLNPHEKYDRFTITFDGVYMNSTVYINGHQLGTRPYGYSTFEYDLTPYINRKGDNVIAVKVDNSDQPNSRWYSGCGIYRHVWLTKTMKKAYIPQWGQYVSTTPQGDVRVKTDFAASGNRMKLSVRNTIYDAAGKIVAKSKGDQEQKLQVKNPHLWDIGKGYLYTVKSELILNGKVVDVATTTTGFRDVKFDARKGFFLNGRNIKLNGVCEHHDFGCLGAAVNEDAMHRKLTILRNMGVNAIRSSHNPPAPELLNMCDSMGILVMDESFDMWRRKKSNGDYARFFDEWHKRDLSDLVKRDRNHPSIIMWSIGNEIPEQWSQEGVEISRHLQEICHQLDPSRPVTQGMDKAEDALKSGFAQVMDVPGFNYRVHKYFKNIEQLPQGFLLGSETASTVSSRGVYKFPVMVSDKATYPDGQCSSYDTEYCSWSNLPDDDWKMQDDYSWVIGEFVWTGYDYLGEPTPYDTYWPSRSSYFGICDLAGLPKDRYYMYRARWNDKQHTTHLLPHWNWKGREGEVTPVYCYTDGVEGELFVNGKSQGRVHKDKSSRLDRYRLRWNNVQYEPGEIRVVTYNQYGDKVGEDIRRTAGEPAQLSMVVECPDNENTGIGCMVEGCEVEHGTHLKADGNDLAFITVSLLDQDGNECPLADDELTFEVSGAGTFKAACNGDATSLEPFTQPQMRLFSGKLVVIVQSKKQKGDITIKVKDAKRNLKKTLILKTV